MMVKTTILLLFTVLFLINIFANSFQLNTGPEWKTNASWSSDDSKIAFHSNRRGEYEIRIMGVSITSQNLLNNPESVIYDPHRNRYLVSNWGDGAIVQIDSNGTQSYFSTELFNHYRLAGLYVCNDTLLAAAGDAPDAGIAGFNLETGELIFFIVLPEIGLPNDITSDKNGIIYVTDYWDDKLYKIKNRVPSILIPKGSLNHPNGMMYDSLNHRLLVLSVMGPGAPILTVNLKDSSVSTVLATGFSGTDGITMDNKGRVYVSVWSNDAIYRYDSAFKNPPELFSTGHDDPADIYYDRFNNILAVPNFSSNTVDYIAVTPLSIEGKNSQIRQNFELHQNYPNPFNHSTIITYWLRVNEHVKLIIFNALGVEMTTLVNAKQSLGYHNILFNGKKFSSGIYYYKLIAGNFIETKKMILLK